MLLISQNPLWQNLPSVHNLISDPCFSIHCAYGWGKWAVTLLVPVFGLSTAFTFFPKNSLPRSVLSPDADEIEKKKKIILSGSRSVLPLYLFVCSVQGRALTFFFRGLDMLSVEGPLHTKRLRIRRRRPECGLHGGVWIPNLTENQRTQIRGDCVSLLLVDWTQLKKTVQTCRCHYRQIIHSLKSTCKFLSHSRLFCCDIAIKISLKQLFKNTTHTAYWFSISDKVRTKHLNAYLQELTLDSFLFWLPKYNIYQVKMQKKFKHSSQTEEKERDVNFYRARCQVLYHASTTVLNHPKKPPARQSSSWSILGKRGLTVSEAGYWDPVHTASFASASSQCDLLGTPGNAGEQKRFGYSSCPKVLNDYHPVALTSSVMEVFETTI